MRKYKLPPEIETPIGTESIEEYLMGHPSASAPDKMEELARKIAANVKTVGTTATGAAKAPSAKFLGAGGPGSSLKAKPASEMTGDDIRAIRALIAGGEASGYEDAKWRYFATKP